MIKKPDRPKLAPLSRDRRPERRLPARTTGTDSDQPQRISVNTKRLLVVALLAMGGYEVVKFGQSSPTPEHSGTRPPLLPTSSNPDISKVQTNFGVMAEMVSPENEEKTNQIITELTREFGEFQQRLIPKIQQVSDPNLRACLLRPFDTWNYNQKNNPDTNGVRIQRVLVNGGKMNVHSHGEFYYMAGQDKKVPNHSAAYSPAGKLIMIPAGTRFKSDIAKLVVFHELQHATFDIVQRKSFRTQADLDQYNDFNKNKIDLADEAMAFALEIELLNILLEGKLRESVMNKSPLNLAEIRTRLNATQTDYQDFLTLWRLSQSYYPQGFSSVGPAGNFIQELALLYKDEPLYIRHADGGVTPYQNK